VRHRHETSADLKASPFGTENDDRYTLRSTRWDRYPSTLDNDRLEEWPDLFTDDCLYEIVPRENAWRCHIEGAAH